jgi:hypothetical protein
MKMNISNNKIQKSISNSVSIKTILKPDVIVLSGIKEIDELTGGFKTGEITFIDGDSDLISYIPNQICVNTYRTLGSDTIYIDGGMCTNPYKIARYARMMEIDQKEVLNHVHISRAFTVHQLSSIIHDMLEPIIKTYNPLTLIIGRFPVLYLDSDIKKKEAQTLLRINLEKIRELTIKYDLITIFTSLDGMIVSNSWNISKKIYSNVNEIVKMKQKEKFIYIELVKKQKNTTILNLVNGQFCLNDFGMVIQ